MNNNPIHKRPPTVSSNAHRKSNSNPLVQKRQYPWWRKKSVTGTLSATVPRITQDFFYQMTLENWYIFLISDNGAMKLSQTFLCTWENRLLNRNIFSKACLHGQNVGRVKNLNESVCRRKFIFWLKCELQFLILSGFLCPLLQIIPQKTSQGFRSYEVDGLSGMRSDSVLLSPTYIHRSAVWYKEWERFICR
jgi:hypothetical protein